MPMKRSHSHSNSGISRKSNDKSSGQSKQRKQSKRHFVKVSVNNVTNIGTVKYF